MPQLDPGLPEPLNPGEKIIKYRFAKETGERTPRGRQWRGRMGKLPKVRLQTASCFAKPLGDSFLAEIRTLPVLPAAALCSAVVRRKPRRCCGGRIAIRPCRKTDPRKRSAGTGFPLCTIPYTRDQFTPYASVQSPSGPLPSPETPARCAIREEIDSSHSGEYAEENAGMGDPETGKTKGANVKFGSDVKSEQKFLVSNTET